MGACDPEQNNCCACHHCEEVFAEVDVVKHYPGQKYTRDFDILIKKDRATIFHCCKTIFLGKNSEDIKRQLKNVHFSRSKFELYDKNGNYQNIPSNLKILLSVIETSYNRFISAEEKNHSSRIHCIVTSVTWN